MKKKIQNMPLETLKENFIVRIALDRDHVEHLKDLIGSGVELDPLLVSADDNELIDGRHRKAAYLELGIKEVKCEVCKFGSLAEKIIAALRSNVGGALPPTHADVNHTMQILLASGESRKQIIEMVSAAVGFPARLVAKHLDEVQSTMAKARLVKAARAVVNDGKTVHEAAAEEGVKLETLKNFMKADGNGDSEGASSIVQVKSYLSTLFGSSQCSQGQTLAKVLRDLKDGLTTPEDAQLVLDHLTKLTARAARHHEEWLKRFASHIGSTNNAIRVEKTKARKSQTTLGDKALSKMGLATA